MIQRISTKIMQGGVYEKMGNMEKAQGSYTKAQEYEHRDYGYGTSTIIFDEQQFYKYITKFFLKVEDFTLAEKYIQKITPPLRVRKYEIAIHRHTIPLGFETY